MKLRTASFKIKEFAIQYAVGCVLFLALIVFVSIDSSLLSVRNLRNILSDAAPLLLVSSGMALCLYAGYIDLSAGAVVTLAGIIAGSLMQSSDTAGRFFSAIPSMSTFLIIPIIMILFYCIGMLNAFFVKKVGLPPWFATLGIASVLVGLAHVYLYDSNTTLKVLSGFTKEFLNFGAGYIGNSPTYSIPITVLISLSVLVVLLICTKCFASTVCPSAPILATKSIIKNSLSYKKILLIYGLAGALFALAGMMLAGRTGSVSVELGRNLGIDAIVICLIGGFSLFGGRGNFLGIFIGTLLYTASIYCAEFIGINQFVPLIVRGIILLTVVSIEIRRNDDCPSMHNHHLQFAKDANCDSRHP